MRKILVATIPIVFLLAMSLAMAAGEPVFGSNTTTDAQGVDYRADNSYGFTTNFTSAARNVTLVWFWTDINTTGGVNLTVSLTGVDESNASGYPDQWTVTFVDVSAGTKYYMWGANATAGNMVTSGNLSYVIDRATPTFPYRVMETTWEASHTYASFNNSFSLTVNATQGATLLATVQHCNGSSLNHTLPLNVTGAANAAEVTFTNYTIAFEKGRHGFNDSQTVGTCRVNITNTYVSGENFTETANASTLYCDWATVGATLASAPSSANTGDPINMYVDYNTTETTQTIIYQNCTVPFGGNTYDLNYASGRQTVTFSNPQTDTGSDTWTITCSNNSFQTSTGTGSILSSGGGGSGGGGGATTTTQTTTGTTTIPREAYCGDGICQEGEYLWNCWSDCNPFKSGLTTNPTEETTTTITSDGEEGSGIDWTSPLVILVVIGIALVVLKKM